MQNPWVGLDMAAEPMAWARLLRRAHAQAAAGDRAPAIVRDVVTRSWERSRTAGIDPDGHAAPALLDERDAAERWGAHPLSRFSELVGRLLGSYTHDARHIVVVSDADGCLLWSGGHAEVLRASNSIAFVPGRLWTEAAAGTNGVGTALALGHPVQIFSAEHFNRQVHGWTCSAAPVRDPETGEILGVLDLSSGIRASHPNSLALVTAVADMVGAQLRAELAERDARLKSRYLERLGAGGRRASALVSPSGRLIAAVPAGWLPARIDLDAPGDVEVEPLAGGFLITQVAPPGRGSALRLRALGRQRALLSMDGAAVTLSRRHSEIAVLLALHPDGLSAEQLACELYGDADKRMSVRAELSRLRRVLGARLRQDPYRLAGDVLSDFREVERLLAAGRRESALKLARGPLLPGASAPSVVAARERLLAGLHAVRQ